MRRASTSYGAANNLNQYVTVGQGASPSVTLTHDANGNLTGEGTWTFAYEAENRLRTANRAGTAASYLYDPLGRRQAKVVNGVTTSFLSDGDEEVAEYTGAGALLRRYIPGPGTDQPVAMVTPAGASHTRSYFHVNRQGSTVAMSNDAGVMAEGPYTYDAYGQGPTSAGVPFKYTGRRLDPETGLYYYRARYYSASLGRFLQTDPIGYADQMNLYAYVGNDPGNATDPSGEATVTCTVNQTKGTAACIETRDRNWNTTVIFVIIKEVSFKDGTKGELKRIETYVRGFLTPRSWINRDNRAYIRFLLGGDVSFRDDPTTAIAPALRFLHPPETVAGNKSSYDYWSKKSTEEIVDSLKPGQRDSLKVKADGTVMDGNTRLTILRERGYDIDSLPRELYE